MTESAGNKVVAALALADNEVKAGVDAQMDGFVRALRAGRRRRSKRVPAVAHASV